MTIYWEPEIKRQVGEKRRKKSVHNDYIFGANETLAIHQKSYRDIGYTGLLLDQAD